MGYHLGVDLGTTFTAAAAMDGTAAPVMVGLGNRALQIPSVLYVHSDGSVLVGEAAELRSSSDPARSVREFKRRIGDPVPILVGGRPYSAQALSARLLRWVVDKSTEQLGEPPLDVTLTYPANWAHFKVDLLRQVAVLADLGAVRACSEPEAAALQYASRARVTAGDRVAVYDLGGGTFDVCVLEKTDAGFRILGRPEGIEHLGGIDFDEALFRRVVEQLPADAVDAGSADDAGLVAFGRLRRDCVQAKEALSTDVEAVVPVGLPQLQTSVRVTRGEFEDIIRPALEDTIGATRRALRSADTDPAQLRAMVLVGGSSRIPLIAEMLGNEFRCPIAVDTHPKNDVAAGAARAGALAQGAMALVWPADPTTPLAGRGIPPAVSPAAAAAGSAPTAGWSPPGSSRATPGPLAAFQPSAHQPAASTAPQASADDPAARQPGPRHSGPQFVGPPPAQPQQPGAQQVSRLPADQRVDRTGPTPALSGSPQAVRRRRTRITLIATSVVVVLLAGVGTLVALRGSNDDGTAAPVATSADPTSSLPTSSEPASPSSSAPVSSSSAASSSVPPTAGVSPAGLPVSAPLPARSIVVSEDLGIGADLITVDADTGDRQVVVVGTHQDRLPLLSPDRGTIFYIEQTDTARSPRVVAANGAGDRAPSESSPAGCDRVNRLAWNPVEQSELAVVCLDRSGSYSLQIVRVDGTAIRTLPTGLSRLDDVSYAPDGTRVAFWGSEPSSFDGGSIYVMGTDGAGTPQQLTTQPAGSDADPVWSPDGSQIAFRRRLPAATPQGNFEIFVMAADGTGATQLTDDPANDAEPEFFSRRSEHRVHQRPGKRRQHRAALGDDLSGRVATSGSGCERRRAVGARMVPALSRVVRHGFIAMTARALPVGASGRGPRE